VNGKDTIFSTTDFKGIARPCHEKTTGRQNVNSIKNEFKMKKLSKLSINLNKVIKNEELVNLRGGSYAPGPYCCCIIWIMGESDFVKEEGYSAYSCQRTQGEMMEKYSWASSVLCHPCMPN
jgi:hypothetical protein